MNDFFTKIVLEGPKPEYVKQLDRFVNSEGSKWTNSQLRNLFETLQNLKGDNFKPNLLKFDWKFAYMVGKEAQKDKKEAYRTLYNNIKLAMQNVNSKEHLQNLKDLFESIVAYHRFYHGEGGKK